MNAILMYNLTVAWVGTVPMHDLVRVAMSFPGMGIFSLAGSSLEGASWEGVSGKVANT